MTNYAHGHEAEEVASKHLKRQGYKILQLNWRRQQAEIDIVAQRGREPLTFIEVKYCETAEQGGGLDYITPRKLEQRRFAAELWVSEHDYAGEYHLLPLS